MIEEIGKEFKRFIKDLEDNIQTKEDLKYVIKRSEGLFEIILKEISEHTEKEEKRLKKIIKNQKKQEDRLEEIESKMEYLNENIENIFKDIYEEEYEEFKIKCPYCNSEFNVDIDENESEISCPECNNIIELDWNDE